MTALRSNPKPLQTLIRSPKSVSSPRSGKMRCLENQENAPPPDPNVPVVDGPGGVVVKKLSSGKEIALAESASVKVAVRIRPVNNTEADVNRIVRKVSPDTLTVEEKTFTFDSVFSPSSTQEDLFHIVGAPLVKDALAGFNTSVICYGETGSGKSYTMWGQLSAMLEEYSASSSQGLAPRIFHMLFSEIKKLQENTDGSQVNIQCRCSFLEIYNEQVNDLLDPVQRNLKIKEENKNGLYVENLSEEYVNDIDEVIQVLVKGLSNRRVGATSVNSKSSRSHVVLTCIIESWCKGKTSKFVNNSKTSRINLVDLAGSERLIPDDASSRYKKEEKLIKKSLSKLGKLVSNVAEVQHGENKKILYRDSCLTNLLRDSLGGNAKATVICAVSPVYRCKSGTLSSLRFGKQAKCIENKPVINEIAEHHLNDLTDQIRQLKDELVKERTCGAQRTGAASDGYFKRHNVRGSLNLLKASLNRNLLLPQIESDPEEEIDANEDNMEKLCSQLKTLNSPIKEISEDTSNDKQETLQSDVVDSCPRSNGIAANDKEFADCRVIPGSPRKDSAGSTGSPKLSVTPPKRSPVFQEPTLCTSPTITKSMKNVPNSPSMLASGQVSFRRSDHVRSSLQSSRLRDSESLAASLHRGLQIMDYHQRVSAPRNSSVGFSFDYLKANSPVLCASCKQNSVSGCNADQENSSLQFGPVSNSESQMDLNKKLEEATKRASDLEIICSQKEATIQQLNHQVEQYKQEIELKLVTEQNHDVNVKEMVVEGCMPVKDAEKNQTEECVKNTNSEESNNNTSFDIHERSLLLDEIKQLKCQLQLYSSASENNDSMKRNSLDSSRSSCSNTNDSEKMIEEFEKERERWMESESKWISLTDELRIQIESNRRVAEKKDVELNSEKENSAELDDALHRAILGHARMVEHIAELQEEHSNLLDQHKRVMEGINNVKRAAAKAGKKGTGSAFARALNAELSTSRTEKEKERLLLKEQNRVLKIQLRDTAEAVHAAGELLVKLRESEEAASVAEEKYVRSQQEVERLRKQMEKLKNKHAMEMVTMKHCMNESRLPESALEPLYRHDKAEEDGSQSNYDNQSWRAAFEPSYR